MEELVKKIESLEQKVADLEKQVQGQQMESTKNKTLKEIDAKASKYEYLGTFLSVILGCLVGNFMIALF